MVSSATLEESELALILGSLLHLHRLRNISVAHDPPEDLPFLVIT